MRWMEYIGNPHTSYSQRSRTGNLVEGSSDVVTGRELETSDVRSMDGGPALMVGYRKHPQDTKKTRRGEGRICSCKLLQYIKLMGHTEFGL